MLFLRRRIPFIPQTAASDCGAACVAMVLAYHGRRLPLAEVREAVGNGAAPADAYSLVDAARAFGLRAEGISLDELSEVARLPRGTILHWRFRHFVVLDRLTAKGLKVIDPAGGERTVSVRELSRCFSGVALVLEPSQDFLLERRGESHYSRHLTRYLKGSGLLGQIVLSSLLLQVLSLALPLALSLVIDEVLPGADEALTYVVCLAALVIPILSGLLSLLRSYFLVDLRTRVDAGLAGDTVEHLVRLPLSYFLERAPGDVVHRLNSYPVIREALTTWGVAATLDGGTILGYLLVLTLVDPVSLLIVLALAGLQTIAFVLTLGPARSETVALAFAEAELQTFQVQLVSGFESLKASGGESLFVDRWRRLQSEVLTAAAERGRSTAWFHAVAEAATLAAPLALLSIGATRALAGQLSLGKLLALVAIGSNVIVPLGQLLKSLLGLQLLGGYFARLADIREAEPETSAPLRRGSRVNLLGRIEARNVAFRYATRSPWVLQNLSLSIEPGELVAIVGPSGAGKSTLGHLLACLHVPTSGQLLIDGCNPWTSDLRGIRRQIGFVPQTHALLSGTVRDNIALLDPTLTDARLVDAARRARIHDDIERLPMGYDTTLVVSGGELSGGQRQRLLLARAFARDARIFVLDEVTSELDGLTELVIREEIERLRGTRIVVSHRLATIQGADRILVLRRGAVAASGTHRELLARCEYYYQLCEAGGLAKETADERV